jgi:outer membrane receptor protein involved in Fe transport
MNAWVKRNARRAGIDGLELTGEYLLQKGWSIYGNYMYIYGQNVTDDEPVDRIPPTQGIVGLRWRSQCRRSWFEIYEWIVARQNRLSARDRADPRIPHGGTPGYHTLNLRAGGFIGNNSKLSLGVENILDRYYRVHGSGIYAPGINFTLGYELSF